MTEEKNSETPLPIITPGIIESLDRLSDLPYPYRMAAIKEFRETKYTFSLIVERQHTLLGKSREEGVREMQAGLAERSKSKPKARADALESRYGGDIKYFADRKIPAELIAEFLSKIDKKLYPDCAYVYSTYRVKEMMRILSQLDRVEGEGVATVESENQTYHGNTGGISKDKVTVEQ